MRLLTWLIALPVALAIIAFAVANRGPTTISLSPLPFEIDTPIWAVAVGAVLFGLIVGSLIRWLLDHKARATSVDRARKIRLAEKEINVLKKKLTETEKKNLSNYGPVALKSENSKNKSQ